MRIKNTSSGPVSLSTGRTEIGTDHLVVDGQQIKRKLPTGTAVISVRMDKRTAYLCELAARSQGRSLSNFIEQAVQQTLANSTITTHLNPQRTYLAFDPEFLDAIWDTDEADRLVKLAHFMPELMTFDEQRIWKQIKTQPDLYASHDAASPDVYQGWDLQKIRDDWDRIKTAS